jgi:hypothetical protein
MNIRTSVSFAAPAAVFDGSDDNDVDEYLFRWR